jgi:hypothetical protein
MPSIPSVPASSIAATYRPADLIRAAASSAMAAVTCRHREGRYLSCRPRRYWRRNPERARVKAPADLRSYTCKTQGHLFRIGRDSPPQSRLSISLLGIGLVRSARLFRQPRTRSRPDTTVGVLAGCGTIGGLLNVHHSSYVRHVMGSQRHYARTTATRECNASNSIRLR